MNMEEFKNTLIELSSNLDNEILRNQIISKDKSFDFDILVDAINKYINNFDIMENFTNDALLNQIKTKIDSLLKLTYEENIVLYAVKFTQYANFIIKNAPQSKNPSKKIKDNKQSSLKSDPRTIQEKHDDVFIYLSSLEENKSVNYKDFLLTDYNELRMIINKLESSDLIENGTWFLSGDYLFHGLTFHGQKVLETLQTETIKTADVPKMDTEEIPLHKSDKIEPNNPIPQYKKSDFPNMRESGSVVNNEEYTVAEYEDRGLRLKLVAEKIKEHVPNHFVLYDKKGSLLTNDSTALRVIEGIYGSPAEIDGDFLTVHDGLFNVSKSTVEGKEEISNNVPSNHRVAIPAEVNYSSAKPAFGIEAIAKILSEIIVNIPEKSGMMVGIFGKWGRGKTYLVNKIWEDIDNNEELNYKRVNFSAWKYQDTKESWAYLYESFMQQYLLEKKNISWIAKIRISKINPNNYCRKSKVIFKKLYHWCLNKIENFLIENIKLWRLNLEKHKWFPLISFSMFFIFAIYWTIMDGGLTFIKLMVSTFGILLSIKLLLLYLKQKTTAIGLFNKYFSKKSYADYLGLQAEVENELENLIKTWVPNILDSNEKIVLFVDDIDRCNIEQIISIVDGLRVILDNPKIHNKLVIITAIDEEVLHNALAHKYDTLNDINIVKNMYQEYLEKVFIIAIKLNKLEEHEIEEFLLKIIPEMELEKSIKNDTKLSNPGKTVYESKSTKSENASHERAKNHIQDYGDISKEDFELTDEEKSYLVKSIRGLDNATPRKIKIFYYKYLILKQLFYNRLEEKDLIHKLDTHCDEKMIMDILIHISNHKTLSDFDHEGYDKDIMETLKYTSNMVSAL